MENDKFLEVFYHDTSIYEMNVSLNVEKDDYELLFILDNEEYGRVKCIISNVISINVNQNFMQRSYQTILEVERIDPDKFASNYIKSNNVASYRMTTNSNSTIDIHLLSDDILIERLSE